MNCFRRKGCANPLRMIVTSYYYWTYDRTVVKKNIDGYGHSTEKLEKRAAKLSKHSHVKKVKVIPPTVDEDVSYDGKTLLALVDNKTLIKSGVTFAMAYPNIGSLDISLAPWYMAIDNAPPQIKR